MPNYFSNLFLLLTFLFFVIVNSTADSKIEHKIAVLVNEDIITSYDIIQRIKLEAILNNKNLSNQLLVNNTVDELIKEKLKQQKIDEYNIKILDDEYLRFEESFFDKNNIDRNNTLFMLEENNISYQQFKNRLINELLWTKLIGRLYLRLTSVSDIEVNEIIKNNPNISLEQAENFVIQRQLDLQSSKLLRDMINEATIEYK